MTISHGTPGQSTQVISIQTPYGVKVTPEQKPGASPRQPLEPGATCRAGLRCSHAVGWTLTIAYRNLTTPLPAGHGRTLSAVPDVITYTAQARGSRTGEFVPRCARGGAMGPRATCCGHLRRAG